MTDPRELGIELRGVCKSFASQVALSDVDLDVPQGSYVAVMGPNGAGKSTLLRVMAGLTSASRGSARIAGIDMRRAGPGLRRRIGFASHEGMLYPDLSARENLDFHARLFGLRDHRQAVDEAADRFGIAAQLDKPVRSLSRGTRQRVAVARALLHDPHVLLMDEPFTGLDEAAADDLAALLRDLHTPDRTIVIVVHEAARALSGAARIVTLLRGKVALDRAVTGDADETLEVERSYSAILRGSKAAEGART